MVRPHPLLELKRRETASQKFIRHAGVFLFAVVALGGYYGAYTLIKSGGAFSVEEDAAAAEWQAAAGGAAARGWPPLVAPGKRSGLAALLQGEGLRVGAEVGVQGDGFAAHMLSQWTDCERYYVIDPSGGSAAQQIEAALAPWAAKTVVLPLPAAAAAQQLPDGSLDFLYLGASRDYCGMLADLQLFWPKLRRGGILAGHAYLTAAEAREVAPPGEDWGLCADGSRQEGAVKGAVDAFAAQHRLEVMVTYREPLFPTFLARKP